MGSLLDFFHSEHDINIMDVELKMLQTRLVVNPSSKVYTISTMLFHKYGGENVGVTNSLSHFSLFVPTRSNMKLDYDNKGNSQGNGIVLCQFPNCTIIYPVVPVYYCPGHPSNTI